MNLLRTFFKKLFFDLPAIIAAAGIIFLTLIIFLEVLMRGFFNYSLEWGDEISRLLLIWVVFLGASAGVKEGAHFGIKLRRKRNHPRIEAYLFWLRSGVMLIFSVLLVITGYQNAMKLQSIRFIMTNMSSIWMNIAIPLAGFFMTIFIVRIILEKIGQCHFIKKSNTSEMFNGTHEFENRQRVESTDSA